MARIVKENKNLAKNGGFTMLAQETMKELQHAPLADRIQAIEVLVESLKCDIAKPEPHHEPEKEFAVRTFNLNKNVVVNREEIYAERGGF